MQNRAAQKLKVMKNCPVRDRWNVEAGVYTHFVVGPSDTLTNPQTVIWVVSFLLVVGMTVCDSRSNCMTHVPQ